MRVFDGEPSCDDVNSYASLPDSGDASGGGLSRCKGCGDTKDILDWDITELELNPNSDWGHYTIYSTLHGIGWDGLSEYLTSTEGEGYKLTPADGGPLAGECTRDNGDDYDCTIAIANTHGTRLFTCKSDMKGIHGK